MAVTAVSAAVGSLAAETVAGAVVTGAWGAGLISSGVAYATTYAAVGAVTQGLVGGVVANALHGNKAAPSQVGSQQARGMLINAASSIDPLPVLYGSRPVGGTYVVPPFVSGASNQYLHLVIALSEGEISAINTVYMDGVASSDARFAGLLTIEKFTGSDTQAASALLLTDLPGWTSEHRGKGVAYLHAKIKYSQNAFHGIPVVTCDLDGKLVYDPRDTTTKFSNNPALCLRDYLTSTRYGRGIGSALIDDASIIVAANHCDEMVGIPGGTQARYTCDGVVDVDDAAYANVQRLLGSCRGMLVFGGGKYKIIIDKTETPSAFTFNEDNITGAWEFHRPGKRDKANKVSASFFNPANDWQPDLAIQNSATYLAQDNGLLLERKIDLPYTANLYRAQHLAQLEMKSSRFGLTVKFGAFQEGLRCEVGDVVPITHSTPGWTAKPFRIMTIDITDFDNVEITAREYDDAAYTLDALDAVATAPATTLPDPFTVGIPGDVQMSETLYETTGSVGVRSKATLTWTAPNDAAVVDYEVEYKLASSGTWIEIFNVRGTQYEFYDLAPDAYDFRVKARNSMGVVGSYTTPKTFTVYGLTAAPADVTGFSVKAMAGMALATWNRTTDLDVKIGGDVVLRWSPVTVGATWAGSVILPDGEMNGDATSAIVPLATGTYFAKFVDSTGHYSDTAASFVATEALVSGWTTVATSTQHAAFTGAKTNVALDVEAQAIKLDGVSLVDDWGDIDDLNYIDSIGGIATSGTYEFDAVMDLSTVAARRFHAHIRAAAYDTADLVDARLALLDTWEDIDGLAVNDCDATVYASVSDDGADYSDWTPFMVADFDCRYAKFRALLLSGSSTHNIQVSELSVTAKILT